MKIDVKQGQCRLDGYTVIMEREGVIILCFNSRDKYPVIDGISDDTLYVNLEDRSPSYRDRKSIFATTIDFTFEGKDAWKLVVGEAGRYSFYVTLFKVDFSGKALKYYYFEDESSASSSSSSSSEE